MVLTDDDLLEILGSEKWEPPYQAIDELIQQQQISNKVLDYILNIKDNNLLIGEFLEKYEYFSDDQLGKIEEYIKLHLSSRDGVFVACLLECANNNGILSFFYECITMIKKRRQDIVVLATLNYIFENMRYHEIDDVIRVFKRVINNKSYYVNCQIVSSFYLFRITMDKKYFTLIKELIDDTDDPSDYCQLIKNMMKINYNSEKYFFYYKDFMNMIKD